MYRQSTKWRIPPFPLSLILEKFKSAKRLIKEVQAESSVDPYFYKYLVVAIIGNKIKGIAGHWEPQSLTFNLAIQLV